MSGLTQELDIPKLTRSRFWWIWQKPTLVAGGILAGAMVLIALLADIIAPGSTSRIDIPSAFAPPSLQHLFGADNLGRDIFNRVIHGTRISLGIGASTVFFTGIIGTTAGLAAGYFRRLDEPVMRLMDALMAFPGVMLAVAIAAALGPGAANIVLALTVVYVPATARIVRSSTLLLREADYVAASRALGAGNIRIILRHILPNSITPLIVQLTFVFAYAILSEAALSFLGLGPPAPTPSWGNVIADGRDYLREAPWICLFPGLALSVAVLGLNLLGDGLRDWLDPRQGSPS